MSHTVDLRIDVTHALDFAEPVHIAATVTLPHAEDLPARPLVCFAKPSGGYSRHYFTQDLPGPATGAEAQFHAGRGWIFVAIDNLGSGESATHASDTLDFAAVTAAAHAAEQEILLRLANGVLVPDFPPVLQPVTLGLGQSTGGSLTIVQQARHRAYDGLAILGFSVLHSRFPTPPGAAPIVAPWYARDALVNAPAVEAAAARPNSAWAAIAWGFHYDDVPREVVEADLDHYESMIAGGAPAPAGERALWNSYSLPSDATRFTLTPGAIAAEAAAVAVPVLSAMGERDLIVDPLGEARAFLSAPSHDLFVCPRMGHMHNFAGTRALLWERIHLFGAWCAAFKAGG